MDQLSAQVYWTPGPLNPLGIEIGRSETAIKLPGGVFLFSPIEYSEAHAQELKELGPVRWIFIPSLRHTLYYDDYVLAFPDAIFIGPEGVVEELMHPPERFVAAPAHSVGLGHEITFHSLAGMPGLREVAAFHHPTGTLLVGDLVFNVAPPRKYWQRLALRLGGLDGGMRMSRPFRASIKDAAAFRHSLLQILDLPIVDVVPAHGFPVRRSGWAALAEAARRDLRIQQQREAEAKA